MTIEGTWEEVAALGDKLSGRNVRLIALEETAEFAPDDEDDKDEDDRPWTWEQWDKEGEVLRAAFAREWPVGVSAVELLLAERR